MLRYREIIELRSIGLSQEKVAYFCGCSTEKVKQVFERASALGLEWPVPIEFSEEELRQLVDPPPDPVRYQPDCKAIFDAVCKEPNTGPKLTNRHWGKAWREYLKMAEDSDAPPYSRKNFEKVYAKWHKARSSGLAMRIDWTPGEEIQVDWAGATLTLYGADGTTTPAYLFVATSPYSYYTFVRASLDMSTQSWLEHHRHMFEFFGGVPLFLAPDNLATGVTFRGQPGGWRERTVNRKYQELADHYGVLVVPTRVNKPTDKAAVETHVRFAAGRIMSVLRQLRFTSIDQLNYAIGELLELFNAKVSAWMGRSRKEIFLEEEAGCLGPLPEKPFKSVTWQKCKASSDAVVNVRGVYYGIPESYANVKVVARISDDSVDVFTLNRKQMLAHHVRHPDGSETFEGFAGRRPDRFKPLDEWVGQNGREAMLEQWHPERNEGLEPSDVVCLSRKKVWWKCPDCGYEWQETPLSRTRRDWDDCLACTGVDLVPGRNDLATLFPDIAAEWHPSKNARPPSEVFPDHAVSAWWVGAECGHEWAAPVAKRTGSAVGALCPYCSGEKALPGFNDVATLCPELAERWHPVKNRERTPENTPVCSTSRVYLWGGPLSDIRLESPRAWLLENGYDDVLEPFLSCVSEARALDGVEKTLSLAPKPMDKDKATVKWFRYAHMWERGASLEDWCERSCRFDILEEWHHRKNGKLTPRGISRSSAQVVWWRCEHGHEWQARVSDRTVSNRGCSICARVYRVVPGVNDLASCKPALLKWYSSRNELPSDQVSDRSWTNAWWECPNCGFEWQRPVNLIPGETLTCPACDKWARRGKRGILVKGVNDLASKRPSVAAQWHPTKNGDLKPENVFWQSRKTAWWLGRCGHEWQAVVSRRTIAKTGCPYCGNKALLPGFNDLAAVHPELAAQWHPTKNDGLLPSAVLANSREAAWWLGECGHEWDAAPYQRTRGGGGCPFCAGARVLRGFNDLASQNPGLASEWHPTRNGDLTPDAVMIGSSRIVWWLGECGHEWQTEVRHRAQGSNCPYCSNKKLLKGFNDLASRQPNVAKRWHPKKNGKLKPKDVLFSSKQLVWWMGKCGHEWEASVGKCSRTGDVQCPYCSHKKVLAGFNDLATTHPELASEWHPRMNKGLKPKDVTARSSEMVWWVCPNRHTWEESIRNRALHNYRCHYCSGRKVPERPLKLGLPSDIPDKQRIGINLKDWCVNFGRSDLLKQWHSEKNGRLRPEDVFAQSHTVVWWRCEHGHEWDAAVRDRTAKNANCPFCSNQRVLAGLNDLASRRPDIAAQWHPEKNGSLKPSEVVPGSIREVWWLGECGHEWEAVVYERTAGHGCPYCAGKKALAGFNDLASQCPKVAEQWHPKKNGSLKANEVLAHSSKKAWWLGKCGHEWEATISSRVNGSGCPHCAGKKVLAGFNDLATTHPELADQWHPTKNGYLKPNAVSAGSGRRVWWRGACGHEWKAAVSARCAQGTNCPYCAGKKVLVGFNDLTTTRPDLTAEWHPTRNGELHPNAVMAGSRKKVWWRCERGHEWEASVSMRALRKAGCPYCSGRAVATGFNDLATTHPQLAAQWHPTKNGGLAPDAVTAGTGRAAWWLGKCGHEWEAAISERKDGHGCPYCTGKKVLAGFNDLRSQRPHLASEWHPTRNGDLRPDAVAAGSSEKAWWLGKCGHEWQAVISSRTTGGNGCPYCAGKKVLRGFNDLSTTHPDLAAEWHPSRNGGLAPDAVTAGSRKKVWWLGKCGHEWEAAVSGRERGASCPYCAGKKVLRGFNDLATTHPVLAAEWHPMNNGCLRPDAVTAGSDKKVWWLGACGHEWEVVAYRRARGEGCPYCAGKKVLAGFNDLSTTHPKLAAQWHPVNNGELRPEDVTSGSNKKVWWQCVLGHEWEAVIYSRKGGAGCPHCYREWRQGSRKSRRDG